MELSWAKTIVMAEESGGQQSQQVVKTLEVPPTTADILNHNLTIAGKWYEIKLPRKGLITWQIRMRENVDINYSYSPTHQTFFTLKAGEVLSSDTSPNTDINAVFVMCEIAGKICEVEIWRK